MRADTNTVIWDLRKMVNAREVTIGDLDRQLMDERGHIGRLRHDLSLLLANINAVIADETLDPGARARVQRAVTVWADDET